MLPWETIDRARTDDGAELVLARRGDEWVVRAAGHVLMSSRAHGSEEALAALGLERAARRETVLVGGLGLGFTVRAVLDRVPAEARVIVVELSRALVAWNRGPVAALAGRPLEDPRVRLQVSDVADRIAEATRAFDAILLDVDNGPSALVHHRNERLYGGEGVYAAHEALRPGGVLAVWSAGPDERYLASLRRAGFAAEALPEPARPGSARARHVIFVAVKSARPVPGHRR
jgi:spermidine synthase